MRTAQNSRLLSPLPHHHLPQTPNVHVAVIQIAIVQSVIVQIMIIQVVVAAAVKVHPKDEKVRQNQRNKWHYPASRRRRTILQRKSLNVGKDVRHHLGARVRIAIVRRTRTTATMNAPLPHRAKEGINHIVEQKHNGTALRSPS